MLVLLRVCCFEFEANSVLDVYSIGVQLLVCISNLTCNLEIIFVFMGIDYPYVSQVGDLLFVIHIV